MNSRGKILSAIANNQPPFVAAPDINFLKGEENELIEKFIRVLTAIGGEGYIVESFDEVKSILRKKFDTNKRIVTTLIELAEIAELVPLNIISPHSLNDIEVAIIKAHFAVAENGSVWVTDDLMRQRVLPFICQHLAIVVDAENIVPAMYEAYKKINTAEYGFGTFISGPSKTADIEQSLVLGAHGSRSMSVFLISTV